jgi:hypothetical protein
MKNTLKITSIFLLIIALNTTGAIAKSRHQHTVGFLKSRSAGGNNGFCSYSIIGSKKDRVVLHTSGGEASMNIDGKEILLKATKHKTLMSDQGKFKGYFNMYSYGIFNVKTNFVVSSAGRNKSRNELNRESGVINISSTDGWSKNINA